MCVEGVEWGGVLARPQARLGASWFPGTGEQSWVAAPPEPRVKPKCTHHTEAAWSWGWLVCWPGAPGVGTQEEEKDRLGQGLGWILKVLREAIDCPLYLHLFFKNLHFEIRVSEGFLPHNRTIHRLPCPPLCPLHRLVSHRQVPGIDPDSGVCPAGLWWEGLLPVVPH